MRKIAPQLPSLQHSVFWHWALHRKLENHFNEIMLWRDQPLLGVITKIESEPILEAD